MKKILLALMAVFMLTACQAEAKEPIESVDQLYGDWEYEMDNVQGQSIEQIITFEEDGKYIEENEITLDGAKQTIKAMGEYVFEDGIVTININEPDEFAGMEIEFYDLKQEGDILTFSQDQYGGTTTVTLRKL